MAYWEGSVVHGFLKSPFIVIYSFIATPILSLFAFPSSNQYFIACFFMMKAMEDQVVQEEPGYQDDEVNLWFIEKICAANIVWRYFHSVMKSTERQKVPQKPSGSSMHLKFCSSLIPRKSHSPSPCRALLFKYSSLAFQKLFTVFNGIIIISLYFTLIY